MSEVWKDVPGYNGLYQVSNTGQVRSAYYHDWRVLSPKTDKDGYMEVCLYLNSKRSTKKVHRLVAEAFIPNGDALPQVNHVDEDKRNNNVTNLEWVTGKQNVNHGTCVDRAIKTKGCRPFMVVETGEVYINQSECARALGSTQQSVYHVLKGHYKSTKGFHLVYLDPEVLS